MKVTSALKALLALQTILLLLCFPVSADCRELSRDQVLALEAHRK